MLCLVIGEKEEKGWNYGSLVVDEMSATCCTNFPIGL